MKILQISSLIIAFFVITGCETQIDVLGEYEEQTIIYGLLDTRETTQYVKINKAFVNPNRDALEIAQESDSLYHPNAMTVQLQEYRNESVFGQPVLLDTATEIAKEPGTFAGPNQLLYKTPAGFKLKKDSKYEIQLIRKSSNEVFVTAVADIVDDINFTFPSFPTVTLSNGSDFRKQNLKWSSAKDARIYEMTLTFKFTEKNKTSGEETPKSIVWQVFEGIKSPTTQGEQEMEFRLDGEEFYGNIANVLTPNGNLERKIDSNIVFNFSYSTQEFANYLEVSKPSTFLNDVKPEYTNVEGGLGLFTSRGGKDVIKGLSSPSVKQLLEGQTTGNLGFVR
ncbi:MAG: hypothetical protein ACJATA_000033 [Sphingobacteriales bacterium]|jgi:hypothetical protein